MQERLKTLQERYRFKLCEDYREFLVTLSEDQFDAPAPEGGHYINVDNALAAWPGVSEPGPAMSKEAVKAADQTHFYIDIGNLYGLSRLESDLDRASQRDGDLGFWNLELLSHAYPVATSYGGDPIIQVTRGKHAGKIFFTNHESWHGFFEHLASTDADGRAELEDEAADAMEELGLESLAALTTDQLIDFMMHESLDGNAWLADSYHDFYRNLCRYRGAR